MQEKIQKMMKWLKSFRKKVENDMIQIILLIKYIMKYHQDTHQKAFYYLF